MADKIGIELGTPRVWAKAAEYAGAGGSRTCEIDLTSLGPYGIARQGQKWDMASISGHLPRRWAVTLRVEFVGAPADGDYVDLYWGASLSSGPSIANPGGLTGADGDYTGTAAGTRAEGLLQLQHIGRLMVQHDAQPVVQQQTSFISRFIAIIPLRFGMPVVVNYASTPFEDDAVEMSVTFTPLEDEKQ